MVDRSLGEVRIARTGRARAAGSVPESAVASCACLLLSALAIASQWISTAKKSEKKLDDLVAFVKATIDVKSTELVLRLGTTVVSTPLTSSSRSTSRAPCTTR